MSESQFDECLEVELTAFKRVSFITMLQPNNISLRQVNQLPRLTSYSN